MKSTFLAEPFKADSTCAESCSHPWWLYANLCSLDAPVVAVVWLFAFLQAFPSIIDFPVYVVLFLTVWSIYISDRLLDGAHHCNWEMASPRHHFVHQHRKVFIGLLIFILTLSATLTLVFLPMELIYSGLILCAVVGFYFTAFVRLFPSLKPLRAKEFACGSVFALGTALGVDALRHGILSQPLDTLPPVLLFAMLCIFNCLVISASERCSDQANDPSAASSWWRQLDRDLLFFGVGLCCVSAVFYFFGRPSSLCLAIFISSFLLTLLHSQQNRVSASISRVAADAVLLSPLLLI